MYYSIIYIIRYILNKYIIYNMFNIYYVETFIVVIYISIKVGCHMYII